MILTAGGVVVCSSCGQERPAGDRFCGMCGTPLPHRPMSTPGAQSTIDLSHGPLENAPLDGRSLTAAVEAPDVQLADGDESATGMPATESLRSASPVSQEVSDSPGEMFEAAPVHLEA